LRPANVVADANHNALIGKIGTGGRPFFVGQRLEFKAETAGRLFLGVNDTGVNNNSGAYQAQVTIRS